MKKMLLVFIVILFVCFFGCAQKTVVVPNEIPFPKASVLPSETSAIKDTVSNESKPTHTLELSSTPLLEDDIINAKTYPVVFNNSMVFGFIKDRKFTDEYTLVNKKGIGYINKNDTFKFYNLSGYVGFGINPSYVVAEEIVQGANDHISMEYSFDPMKFQVTKEKSLSNIGINADWEPLPRTISILSNEIQVYKNIINDILEEHGFSNEIVNITQTLKVDLEGDGQDEVIIVASNHNTREYDGFLGKKYYSIVLARKIDQGGSVQNIILNKDFFVCNEKSSNEIIHTYCISIILDIDGDGIMEIFLEDNTNGPWYQIDVIKLNNDGFNKVHNFSIGG